MVCCEKHDRMDLKLTSEQYLDHVCGAPTRPEGERRFCCGKCPSANRPVVPKAQYASNPVLLGFLPDDVAQACVQLAVEAGPTAVDLTLTAGQ